MIYYPVCSYSDDTGELDYLALLYFDKSAVRYLQEDPCINTNNSNIKFVDFLDTFRHYDGEWWLDPYYLENEVSEQEVQRTMFKEFFDGGWK